MDVEEMSCEQFADYLSKITNSSEVMNWMAECYKNAVNELGNAKVDKLKSEFKIECIQVILKSRMCSTTPIAALRSIGEILQVEVKLEED